MNRPINFHPQARPRHLVIVLGDQLDDDSAGFDGFDPELDAVWMAEVAEESTHVWSHKARIAVFLSAMRHFRDALRQRSVTVHYRQLDEAGNHGAFVGELTATFQRLSPQKLIVVEPGEWRVRESLQMTALALGVDLELRPDRHFLSSREEFAAHAKGRKQLRMEFFYREMRRKHDVLMEGEQPVGGTWNFDADNRESFGRSGPGNVPQGPFIFDPMRPRAKSWCSWPNVSPSIPDAPRTSIGQGLRGRRKRLWMTSSSTACRISGSMRTPCGVRATICSCSRICFIPV